jgi:hypothetical protein
MAIVTEEQTINGVEYIHTKSDSNKKIKQVSTGIVYDDAMDLKTNQMEYEETDEDIEGLAEMGEFRPVVD